MKRRDLLAGAVALAFPGCLDRVPLLSDDSRSGLRFQAIYPRNLDRDYIDYEYVRLVNRSESPLPVAGYSIEYPTGRTFTLGDLELNPCDRLVVRSTEGTDTTLDMAPRVYIRHAGFGEGEDADVIAGTGVLRLRDPSGTVVDEMAYDESDAPTRRDVGETVWAACGLDDRPPGERY